MTTTTEAPPVGTLSEFSNGRAELTVPMDHDDPDGSTIQVPVWRRSSTDPEGRLGVLLVNPGGPGFPAGNLVTNADFSYSAALRSAFDIVALDPRGTFSGTRVECDQGIGEWVSAVDWSPADAVGLAGLDAHVQAWVDACADAHGDLLDHISTMDTVHDLALLVSALGEDQVSWLGFSYGTVLGAAFATEYPDLVRAAVFDGAFHPVGDPLEERLIRARGFEERLVSILADCDRDPECPLEAPSIDSFRRVAAAADARPFDGAETLPSVNARAFATMLLFDDAFRSGTDFGSFEAIAAAADGDGSALQGRFRDALTPFVVASANTAIECMDNPYRGTTPYPDDALEQLVAAAPTWASIFPVPTDGDGMPLTTPALYAPWAPSYAATETCAQWPFGPDLLPSPLSGDGAGPILVVTATGDLVTPLGSAQNLAEELVNGTVLVVEDAEHVSYAPFGNDAQQCAAEAVDDFLVDLEVPPEGFVCGP